LIAEHQSILSFRQDDHMGKATYYGRFTTRVEVARQAGICYYTPVLLKDKATALKLGDYEALDATAQKRINEQVEQEYLAYLFLSNSSNKLHSQLKKDVANDYSKGNTDAYPTNIHKALTLMNEYKPLKIDAPSVPAQGTAFATKGKDAKNMAGDKRDAAGGKFLKAAEWNALSPEEQEKIIEARKKTKRRANHKSDDDDKSTMSHKSMKSLSKTIKSLEKSNKKLRKLVSALQKCEEDSTDSSISSSEGTNHFQVDLDLLEETNPKIVLALKSSKHDDLELRNVLLLDNQSTFDLCCNKKFTSQIFKAKSPLLMTSNGGGLKISHKCKIPGYKF
jgi:hypothetical protein